MDRERLARIEQELDQVLSTPQPATEILRALAAVLDSAPVWPGSEADLQRLIDHVADALAWPLDERGFLRALLAPPR